jgi:hypothetical protein
MASLDRIQQQGVNLENVATVWPGHSAECKRHSRFICFLVVVEGQQIERFNNTIELKNDTKLIWTRYAMGLYKWKIRVHQRILYSRSKMRNQTVFGWLMLLVANILSGMIGGSSTLAPVQACYSMMTGHNSTAQMSPAPFYILIDDDGNGSREKTSKSNQTSSVNGRLLYSIIYNILIFD